MLRVVDSSIVAKWFLPEEHRDKGETILREFLEDKVELAEPDLLVAEFGNVLRRRSTPEPALHVPGSTPNEWTKQSASRSAGRLGGAARAKVLSPERRKEIAAKANRQRWKDRK